MTHEPHSPGRCESEIGDESDMDSSHIRCVKEIGHDGRHFGMHGGGVGALSWIDERRYVFDGFIDSEKEQPKSGWRDNPPLL